jgi:hypothetical protein
MRINKKWIRTTCKPRQNLELVQYKWDVFKGYRSANNISNLQLKVSEAYCVPAYNRQPQNRNMVSSWNPVSYLFIMWSSEPENCLVSISNKQNVKIDIDNGRYHTGHFQSLTNVSWLTEAIFPVVLDAARAAIKPSWALLKVMAFFSLMSQSSKDWHK